MKFYDTLLFSCPLFWEQSIFMGLGRQIWGPGNQVGLSLI